MDFFRNVLIFFAVASYVMALPAPYWSHNPFRRRIIERRFDDYSDYYFNPFPYRDNDRYDGFAYHVTRDRGIQNFGANYGYGDSDHVMASNKRRFPSNVHSFGEDYSDGAEINSRGMAFFKVTKNREIDGGSPINSRSMASFGIRPQLSSSD